jgi:hypothetical protein
MKALVFSIWKYLHLHDDAGSRAIGCPDQHPTVGLYSTLCSLEQGARSKERH